jgi:hypothetical protein
VHGISVSQAKSKPRRKRPTRQRYLKPEADPLSRQSIGPRAIEQELDRERADQPVPPSWTAGFAVLQSRRGRTPTH